MQPIKPAAQCGNSGNAKAACQNSGVAVKRAAAGDKTDDLLFVQPHGLAGQQVLGGDDDGVGTTGKGVTVLLQ
ncbi:hypothetical protein SDC9_146275 [bioreactor metagenome]|uniref:Uncharacterized protein n=1 Tax=bioreactor metagenome TaxID=1076179 RepID=A0A645EC74_9ZZZZ